MKNITNSSLLALLLATSMAGSALAADRMEKKPISWQERGAEQTRDYAAVENRATYVADESSRLNIGDTVKITTYGHEDLSGEFAIESNGNISMPLIGAVKAMGKTQKQLENEVRQKLASGFLVDPKVSIEVANYRQFYIVGEVDEPGAYDYVPSLNVIKAIAIAGGFTRRAVDDEFVIVRTKTGKEEKMAANEETVVLPGDTIRVEERFF